MPQLTRSYHIQAISFDVYYFVEGGGSLSETPWMSHGAMVGISRIV